MKAAGLRLAIAESMTCGLAAYGLSACIGASDVLKGAISCYAPEVKIKLLKVPSGLIDKCSCESQEVTDRLAKNLHRLIKADVCSAITGLASEGGSECEGKPVGTVFLSVYFKNEMHSRRKLFRGTPKDIKIKACKALYTFIQSLIP